MNEKDFPVLYQQSDSRALSNQRNHFRLLKAKIVLLLILATTASISWNQGSDFRTAAAFVVGTVLITLMAFTAIEYSRKFDKLWFSCRAVAESTKKESWLFMMKVKPYDGTISEPQAEKLFLDRLEQVLESQQSICSELTPQSENGSQITANMRTVRETTVNDRLAYYIDNRVRDQQAWYSKEARKNGSMEFRWFISSWVLQLIAAILAFLVVFSNGLIVNPVGILTTAGVGVLSWMNARSFRELSQSYALIAQRLSILGGRKRKASTELDLSEIVIDFEQAISGEHTIWLARRLEIP